MLRGTEAGVVDTSQESATGTAGLTRRARIFQPCGLLFLTVLGTKFRASYILGKCSIIWPYLHSILITILLLCPS